MKKQILGLLILALLIFALLTIHCGGGGGGGNSSTGGSYRTNVEIVLQTTRSASLESRVLKETSQIPSGVVTIRFTISAPDMDTIRRDVTVAGRTTIVETFGVPVGPNRRFLVEALDSAGNVVFLGDVYAAVGGVPLSLSISMVSSDPMTPIFAGLVNIGGITSNSALLSWAPASDNMTPQNKIQYLIYKSTSPGGQNLNADPSYVTPQGATSYQVTDLSSTTYYFVVRARDERGNVDQNVVERSATILDITPPVFGGLEAVVASSVSSIQLSWSQATDNQSLSGSIVYLIYMATSSGGQIFSSPSFTTAAGATSYPITGFTPNTPYYFVVRARDGSGNIDGNTTEVSITSPYIDLAVVLGEGSVYYGEDNLLHFDVENKGNYDAVNVVVEVPYGYCSTGCPSQTVTVPANSSVSLSSSTVTFPGAALIRVDPYNAIPETDETNNEYCFDQNESGCQYLSDYCGN
jgi:hypothetical protein